MKVEKNSYKSLQKIKISKIVRKIFVITFLLILVFITILFLPWQQNVKGYGELIAFNPEERPYKLYSPINGFIDHIYVKDDQFVKKGTILIKITDLDKNYTERIKKIIKNIQNQIDISKKNLDILKEKEKAQKEKLSIGIKAYDNKIKQAELKLKQLENKETALKKSLEIAKFNYERIKKLYNEGIESKRKLEIAENKYIKAKTELENIKIEKDIYKNKLEVLKKEKEKFKRDITAKILETKKYIQDTKNKIKELNQKLIKTQTKLSRYQTATIKAKEDGYVVRVLKNTKNQYIKKGEPVLIFLPKVKKRALLVKFNSVDMPLIKKGLPARIQFEGWPSLQIPGWPKISVGTFSGYVKKTDPMSLKNGEFYAFIVESEEEKWPSEKDLRIGTKATVWVRLAVVPIWYEIWRQVNGFPPVMVKPEKEDKK